MALKLADRVQETTTTAGTGTLSLAGAASGFQSFVAGIGNGNSCYYTIYDPVAPAWEVGIGTVTSGAPNTLSRTTVLSSSNGGALVNLAGNAATVWCDYPAEKAVYLDASGNASPLGTIASGTWQATTISVSYGGTGLTSTPSNGQIDIGNGSGFTRTTLSAGAGVSVTNGSGSITVAATGSTLNSQTSAYTLVAGDAGKSVSITTGGVTVPSSVLSAGNMVTIYNNSGSSQTITQGSGLTLQWAGQTSSTTGNRTLGLYGIATILFISGTTAVISGVGLT